MLPEEEIEHNAIAKMARESFEGAKEDVTISMTTLEFKELVKCMKIVARHYREESRKGTDTISDVDKVIYARLMLRVVDIIKKQKSK